MKLLLLAPLAALCVSCSTTPTQHPTAAELIYDLPVAASATPARVLIVRDTGFVGSQWTVHVSVDGRKIATLWNGQAVEFPLDAGAYQFSAAAGQLLTTSQPQVIEATLAQGQQVRYRVGFDGTTAALVFYRDVTAR